MQMMDALVGLVARVPARVQAKLLAAFLAIAMLLIMMGAVTDHFRCHRMHFSGSKVMAAPSPVSATQLIAMPVHLGLPILCIPLIHHGAVIEAQELRRPGVLQQEPHYLLIPGKYLQDHSSNPLATDYAEIAQNSFADALMLGTRETSVLM
jgi:hypothetical protein